MHDDANASETHVHKSHAQRNRFLSPSLPFSLSQKVKSTSSIIHYLCACSNNLPYKYVWACPAAFLQASARGIGMSIPGIQKSKLPSMCSQQLRLVEVDPEEHSRAQGDDENSPAKLQQCVTRVASMRDLRHGQHCSRDGRGLCCSVFVCLSSCSLRCC
ncbi:unnamed protein product [Durusdinium trenchii]|uniref:Uncharacterized protein n=1 Tax=Durusdinium trenchii TaxID=1381693 RepID=A0ABP0Q9X1_9DINO